MKLGIFTAVLIIFIGVIVVRFSGDPERQAVPSTEVASEQQSLESFVENSQPAQEFTTTEAATTGRYLPYTETAIADSDNDTVVLFFNAAWCPTCQVAKKSFQENANMLPDGITILDADYDQYSDLRKQYGVTTQHTFVQVTKSGEFVKKWTGSYVPAQISQQVI